MNRSACLLNNSGVKPSEEPIKSLSVNPNFEDELSLGKQPKSGEYQDGNWRRRKNYSSQDGDPTKPGPMADNQRVAKVKW